MRYRRLGAAGVKVSEVSLGSWLTYGGHVAAERVVGQALARYPRTSYVLATKVYFPMGDGPNDRGLSRKHIVESCEASLRRLDTDYIGLYQCHRFDPTTPLE